MKRHRRAPAVILVLFLLLPSHLLAWSYKEHILFTRLAATRLIDGPTTPAPLKSFLTDALGQPFDMAQAEDFFMHTKVGIAPEGMVGISYWAFQPDVHAGKDPGDLKIAPFGVHERLLHFIDLELMLSGDARRGYQHDLSGKPGFSDIPRDMKDPRYIQAGMLPFRIEYCYNQLVTAIRENRLTAPTPAEQEGKTAIYWAGYLAHYLADNTQPQHATLDYKSQTYFADKRRAPNVHSEVEYRMCDDAENDFMDLRREFWPRFAKYLDELKDPEDSTDPWVSSVQTSLISYDALPLIGLAAMHAAGQAGTPQHPTGPASANFDTRAFFRFKGTYMGREMTVEEMKAIQTAWAVHRIQRFFLQAWNQAKQPG